MSAVPKTRYTYEEYLEREAVADNRSEYFAGEIFALSGGSPRHDLIAVNMIASLRGSLRGSDCRPCGSNQRIRIPTNGLGTYPDLSIVCGELQLDPQDRDAINNPRVIVEVLSRSTESYDRGKKFDFYRDLLSLREYILVSQTEPLVERYVRQDDDTWLLTVSKGLDSVLELPSLARSLPLREIYEDVTFGPEDEAKADK